MDKVNIERAWMSQDPLVRLAYETVDQYTCTGSVPKTPELPSSLPKRAGCFVSLHMHSSGDLRGCIGTIEPVSNNLAEEIIKNAVSACSQDPRFPKVSAKELEDIEISVDVLFPPEPTSIDGLDPKRYGVIVSSGYKRGLLLPDLEGVDTVEKQVGIAQRKAGISPGSRVKLERFEVVRHV